MVSKHNNESKQLEPRWVSSTHKHSDSRHNAKNRALRMSMPPAAPVGMTFDDVLKQEYKQLQDHTQHVREINDLWVKAALHVSPHDFRALYRERPCEVRPQVHIGQLKLFLSELQFLTEFSSLTESTRVVYAGAADGRHIAYLAQLMPNLNFHLFDPRPFSPELTGLSNVVCMTGTAGWFDKEKAKGYHALRGWSQEPLLFISDIRTGDHVDPTCDFNAACGRDMQMQMEWIRIMKPDVSMSKFRLSYKPGKTMWLTPATSRHLKYGIFAAKSATEMRLICRDPYALAEYDNTQMEEISYYFNNVTRVGQYGASIAGVPIEKPNAIKESLGMDNCFDCHAMREVCLSFLTKKHEGSYQAEISEVVEVTATAISSVLNMPMEIADIIARYTCVVDEDELYGFIGACIHNCGSNANYKMHARAHHEHALMESWINRMDRFRGSPMTIKKTKKRVPLGVVDEIHKLYAPAGKCAPPLGEYPRV